MTMVQQQQAYDLSHELRVICPVCKTEKILSVPSSVISNAKNLATISIPNDLVCKHSFQFFVDKQFKIRGYQRIHYEIREQTQKAFSKKEANNDDLKKIYDEFWELIDDDNEEFKEFIKNDKRRKERTLILHELNKI